MKKLDIVNLVFSTKLEAYQNMSEMNQKRYSLHAFKNENDKITAVFVHTKHLVNGDLFDLTEQEYIKLFGQESWDFRKEIEKCDEDFKE